MLRMTIFAAAAFTFAAPAPAAVTSATDHGFEIRHEVLLAMPPAEAWTRIGRIQDWWSKDHTYSGNAANLRLALVPGGCFCETFPGGGGIEHLRVTYADPGKRAVLTGGLGPLLYEGVAGALDIQLKPEGAATRVTVTYRAAGFARANGKGLAPLVDQVLGEQVARLGKP
jgi:uncharacterized protein YndB with AHSA1/START domain